MRCTSGKWEGEDEVTWVTEVHYEGGEVRLEDVVVDECRWEAIRFYAMRPDIDWFQAALPAHIKFPTRCHGCVITDPPSDLWEEVTFDEWNLLRVLYG